MHISGPMDNILHIGQMPTSMLTLCNDQHKVTTSLTRWSGCITYATRKGNVKPIMNYSIIRMQPILYFKQH
ncbi:hypothetical protein AQUCO_01700643v1 [Aquilegia coerulea]|uniref:Uncharacterized protein n=1 Tax=Aquilegia coerulea TaxID=218851 RepID=A0A2G5DP04_AQUCA|nr:hypothetical protein AQUCO_01700643v1 [Aquilegia coerulea]